LPEHFVDDETAQEAETANALLIPAIHPDSITSDALNTRNTSAGGVQRAHAAPMLALGAHSYADFYGRSSLVDPHGGDYVAVFKAYKPPGPPDAQELLQKFSLVNDCSVFVCLGRDHQVHVFHRLARHTTPLGVHSSASDNQVIAIQGDVTPVGANFVTVTEAFFSTIDAVNIPTAENVTIRFANDLTRQQLTAQTGGARFSTRRAMLVPPPYVPMLFAKWAGGPISPRCFWSIAELVQNHPTFSVSCRVFVDWCRVVAGGGAGHDNP
jgi:hypothetical protein